MMHPDILGRIAHDRMTERHRRADRHRTERRQAGAPKAPRPPRPAPLPR
ncbi:hypothetical protein ACQEU5_01485 [Marinactinospora thermotolerans]